MQCWDSYRAVYGAELRAAAREFGDHGWPAAGSPSGLLLVTGMVLDVLEMPAESGRQVCARLRSAGLVVPVAATPSGTWWFPVAAGSAGRADVACDVLLHTDGDVVLAPPSELPDGWVHWRVSPAQSGWELPRAAVILSAVAPNRAWYDLDIPPGAQRPEVGVAVGMRS